MPLLDRSDAVAMAAADGTDGAPTGETLGAAAAAITAAVGFGAATFGASTVALECVSGLQSNARYAAIPLMARLVETAIPTIIFERRDIPGTESGARPLHDSAKSVDDDGDSSVPSRGGCPTAPGDHGRVLPKECATGDERRSFRVMTPSLRGAIGADSGAGGAISLGFPGIQTGATEA